MRWLAVHSHGPKGVKAGMRVIPSVTQAQRGEEGRPPFTDSQDLSFFSVCHCDVSRDKAIRKAYILQTMLYI
ncbi:hypothetical protein CapIbe_023847 [Capra ibex]